MSKIALLFLLIYIATVSSFGQGIEATITLDAASRTATVEGRFPGAHRQASLVFLGEFAGTSFPNDRIRAIRLIDNSFKYTVDLSPVEYGTSHLSWVADDIGVLMPSDLLPRAPGKALRLMLRLPRGWGLFSADGYYHGGGHTVPDIDNSVFYIGTRWRVTDFLADSRSGKILISGDWQFTDPEAAAIANEVYSKYSIMFGSDRGSYLHLALMRLPASVPPGRWDAVTRGRSMTLASSDMPFKAQSLQRLHEQLRHEAFHIWIPNGVDLTGNYDWFYEGSALYQSLKLGVGVNRIRFDDMLDTLGRAYDVDRQLAGKLSLVDASKNRWSGTNNTLIYARGMLIAFLSDLALLNASKGKRSTDTIVREVYSKYRQPSQPRDGNSAVLEILRSNVELIPIVDQYISGTNAIDWSAYLRIAGLEPASVHGATRIAVTAKPSSSQKKLLDKLGYNNWRKLSKGNK